MGSGGRYSLLPVYERSEIKQGYVIMSYTNNGNKNKKDELANKKFEHK